MYIIIRGECIIKRSFINEETGKEEEIVLGRYGPNGIMCCAE